MAARLLLLSALVISPAQSILQTATIDVLLPGVPTPLTLLASQASFGPSLVSYTDGHHLSTSSSSSRPAGVGLIPSTPPSDDPFLCNDWITNKNTNNNNNNNDGEKSYNNAALLVPRGQCSFQRKALSAQRLGASAIIIYGSLSSRYALNVTNTTNDDGTSNNDAYTRNDYTMEDVIWPTDKQDYDCSNGQAFIPSNVFEKMNFLTSPGGYVDSNDEYLIGNSENNVCVKYAAANDDTSSSSSSFVSSCESQRCLVTGNNVTTDGGSDGEGIKYEACCAWDFAIWLYQDTTLSKEEQAEVTIPAVYITMQQATEFLDLMNGVNNNENGNGDPIVLSMYARDRPYVNSSAIIIWALGVFVAWLASYHSSGDYRSYAKAIQMKSQWMARAGGVGGAVAVASSSTRRQGGGGGGDEYVDERPPSSPGRGDGTPRSRSQSRERNAATASAASPPSENGERTIYRGGEDDAAAVISNRSVQPRHQEEESLELDASHALGFIVMASTSLLVLFYFKIFNVVKIFYAFGCSGAFAQVVLYPLLTRIFRKLRWKAPMRPMECLSEENATRAALNGGCKGKILMCLYSFFGPMTHLDVMANTIAYAVGGTWLYMAFTVLHPESHLFYWIVQDIFGACMCITFLGTIKINAIRVAAILLTVAFFYDIFFVFVTPLLTKHGESIMVNVATSGGPPKADPSWCEKYPSSEECKGGEPLPMLFAIPRIGDYQGGSSMLGLGDIVLPGLLLSFASRFDEAKRLMGLVSGGSGRVRNGGAGVSTNKSSCNICCGCGQGRYFGPVVVAYAIGLAMANAAVYLMQMGQPALLYLVPCCLGTFVVIARRNGELNDIWENPRAIRAADALLFGGTIEAEDEDDVRTSSLLMNEGAEMT
ncbi:hypothetical protein ACHAWT_008992 [Skeletonema menzelii]